MKLHGKVLVCSLSGLVLCTAARAARMPNTPGTPAPAPAREELPSQQAYQKIPERNIFNLRPQVTDTKPLPPEIPLPKITLTGITTLSGAKRALLETQAPAGQAKPAGQPPKPGSYILAEGQREDEIEVVEIDENAGIVRVNNRGTPQTLDFVKNGTKPPTLPAQPNPTPTAPNPTPGSVPTPTLQPTGVPLPPPAATHITAPAAVPMPAISTPQTPAVVPQVPVPNPMPAAVPSAPSEIQPAPDPNAAMPTPPQIAPQ